MDYFFFVAGLELLVFFAVAAGAGFFALLLLLFVSFFVAIKTPFFSLLAARSLKKSA